ASTTRDEPFPGDTEAQIGGFTELVATAIANAQAREELQASAEDQAALQRIATLVAGGAAPEEVFASVAAEVGRLPGFDFTFLVRYDADQAATNVAVWSGTGALPIPVGTRLRIDGRNVPTLVFQTGRPARIDDLGDTVGPVAEIADAWGIHSAVGVPISVEGRLWGVISVMTMLTDPLPKDTEVRLAGFTELVGTAIANAQARVELRRFAEEQAALRQIATLVARVAAPEEVFAAVAADAGRVLSADAALLSRYDPDGAHTAVGAWSISGTPLPFPVGTRTSHGGRNVTSQVFETGRPARIDDYSAASGPTAHTARGWGTRSAVGVPISVEGRLWGVLVVGSRVEPLPADTEAQLTSFSELVATALANAAARAALTASRARIVAAADTTRRRIERDLHDGAQQRLVSLALRIRGTVQSSPPPEAGELTAQMELVAEGLTEVLDQLREIARGIHPSALAEGGLRPALQALVRRSPVPVRLDVGVDERLSEPVELAAYYVVAEALTNTAKHADASVVEVRAESAQGMLQVRIRDDGRGGADFGRGTGLLGLTDRVEALGGRLSLHSPPGAGTTMEVTLPLTATAPRGHRPKPRAESSD
ncbi:MAG: histidine kinase, partial [Marmoricola sp.]|nr:histidine kinase [Marmoricola sp.]